MIKLKNLIKEETKHNCECGGECCSTKQINESAFNIDLPQGMEVGKVFTGHGKAFAKVKEETFDDSTTITESNIKVIKSDKIDYKVWRNMKYDLQKQFYELEKIGEDYGVFQNAQGTHRILKQIKKLIHKL